MSKAGWGFSKDKNTNITTNQRVEKKNQAFWEAANDNIMIIPDVDAEQ